MNDIFISYKVHNRKVAISYYKSLRDKGYRVWFDQLTPKNANWKEFIKEELKKSSIVLCLLSKECLLDSWVLEQVTLARKFHKKIIFITLDDTLWDEHKEYKVKESLTSLSELPFDFVKSIKKDSFRKKIYFGLNLLYLNLFAILLLCFGAQFFNVTLKPYYGYIFFGIEACVLCSYIKLKWFYFIQGFLALTGLCLVMYVMPKFYISSISINPVFYLLFFMLSFNLRYSKLNVFIGTLLSLIYAIVLSGFVGLMMIFIMQFWNFDISWLCFIVLILYFVYRYFIIYKKK